MAGRLLLVVGRLLPTEVGRLPLEAGRLLPLAKSQEKKVTVNSATVKATTKVSVKLLNKYVKRGYVHHFFIYKCNYGLDLHQVLDRTKLIIP